MIAEFLQSLTKLDVSILLGLASILIVHRMMKVITSNHKRNIAISKLRYELDQHSVDYSDLDLDAPDTPCKMRNRFTASYFINIVQNFTEYIQEHDLTSMITLERANIIDRATNVNKDQVLGLLMRINKYYFECSRKFKHMQQGIIEGNITEMPEHLFKQEEFLRDDSLYGIVERILNDHFEGIYQKARNEIADWKRRNEILNRTPNAEILNTKLAPTCEKACNDCLCDSSNHVNDPVTPVHADEPTIPRKSSVSHINIPNVTTEQIKTPESVA